MEIVVVKRKPRKAIQRRPRAKKKRGGEKSVSQLMKDLDAVFSRWVRLSFADKDGIVSCYTCGYQNHYKKMQNGHYISRFYKQTRWDERNCRVQCAMCNLWKNGDATTFRENLVKEYGEQVVQEMEASRKISQKLDHDWLIERIAFYTSLVLSLRERVV